MATKLYILNQTATFIPTTPKGAWGATPSPRAFALETVKAGGLVTSVGEGEVVSTAPHSVLVMRAVTGPLQTQTISGNFDVILGVKEANADADYFWHVHVYVSQGGTDLVRGTLVNNYTEDISNEFPTTETGRTFLAPVVTTPVNAISGDKLIVELGYVSRNIHTTNRLGSIYYGTQTEIDFADAVDLVAGTSGTAVGERAGTINFTQTLLFEPVSTRLAHTVTQTAEDVANTSARITQIIAQIGEDPPSAPTRIAHIVIQVVEGPAVTPGPIEISGIYFINPNKSTQHDSYYGFVEKKIPNPTIKTALFGE